MRVAFYTLGCKVNQYETENLKSRFSAEGYDIVSHNEDADIYIVNSCTVTATGDKKTRQILHRFQKQNPSALLVLTGCMPQAFPEKAEHLPEAHVVTGSTNRGMLLQNVKRALQTGERVVDITPHHAGEGFEPMKAERFSERTRVFVKIEDGCDRYCTYCIIPKARGPVRSKPLDDLKEEAQLLAENGYREIVLVGINLSSYGRDTGHRLVDAVETVCVVDGIERVRLGSLEPELMTDEDIKRLRRLPKFCPQFHLSLQSGCDATLERMHRHYDTAFYAGLADKLRRHFPDCAITTDIMVGFPGETEEEFAQTLQFVQEIGFAQAHVFAYSVREGTKAAQFPMQIAASVKAERSKRLSAVTAQSRRAFMESQKGKVLEVLFETTQNKDGILGYTKNYVPVAVAPEEQIPGGIFPVEITGNRDAYCIGKLHR